jgi:GTP-binding protein EngB required for normal cell division
MNDNHTRHLLATFRHIDGLLSEVDHVLATAGLTSPFAEYTQDSTPVQRKVVHDYIQRVRQAMGHAMTDLGLPRPAPVCGALWAASGHFNFAHIAVAEIEPQRLLGYGALSGEDIKAIGGVAAELNAAIERLMAYLAKGPDADLQARLQRLDQTGNEVALLRELERVISAHGLVEFRGALALLLDRMENGSFEIGVFGRVSSGKSSLLNHLLGMEVLPVGVTPVTAIPTRVRHGPTPRAVIEFAESKPVEIELARLAEFSTEQQNPGNTRHVTRIQVELPSPRLSEGVTFVDTPGLGSLATSGAEETLAYLPRCDLGLVLVDAASTLTHEDLATVQALCQSGARAMVLGSKADLLRPTERQQTLAYAQQQIEAQLGFEVPVRLVSVMDAEARLCDEWFERELKPLLESHREQAAASLKRKAGGLREALLNTLKARLQGQVAGATDASREQVAEATTMLRKTDALVEAAEHEAANLVYEVPDLTDALLTAAASEMAATWRQRRPPAGQSGALCAAALGRAVGRHTTGLVERVESLRRELEQTLTEARRAAGAIATGTEPLPRPSGLPMFDPGELTPKLELRPPRLLRRLGTDLRRRWARSQLQRQAGDALRELLSGYRRRLSLWLSQTLAELRAAFHAQAGPLRAQLESRASASVGESGAASLEADLRRLQEGSYEAG